MQLRGSQSNTFHITLPFVHSNKIDKCSFEKNLS